MEGSYPREIQFPQERVVRSLKIEQRHRSMGTSAIVTDIFSRQSVQTLEDSLEAAYEARYEHPEHGELMRLEFEEDVKKLYHSGMFGVVTVLHDRGHADIAQAVSADYETLRKERVTHTDALEFIEATIRLVDDYVADCINATIDALRERQRLPRLY